MSGPKVAAMPASPGGCGTGLRPATALAIRHGWPLAECQSPGGAASHRLCSIAHLCIHGTLVVGSVCPFLVGTMTGSPAHVSLLISSISYSDGIGKQDDAAPQTGV